MWCGAGVAGADTGDDTGSADRGVQSSAAGAESAAKPNRTGSRGATSRVAPPESARVLAARTVAAPAAGRAVSLPALTPAVSLPTPTPAVSLPTPTPAVFLPTPTQAVSKKGNVSPAAAVAAGGATLPAPKPAAAAAAAVPVVPSSVPIDAAQFAGTYYEQGSVKQFFSIGLVNTKATYTLKSDGTLRVQNSGNYFFNRGPKSSITGSAVPVNAINTALNVGFFGAKPSANPPGNYLILDRAPDYSWVIVSDPSGRSGYILTRDKTIDPKKYQELVAQAQALGVRGRITTTRQFPA
jgi:lipocalin